MTQPTPVDGNPAISLGRNEHLTHKSEGKAMDGTSIEGVVRDLLGNRIALTPVMGNLGLYETAGHSTTGIPYALNGSAQVVSHDIGVHLAAFEDPIKAALGVRVVDCKKVLVKTRQVVGGGAQITPERSAARTIGIKEDVREIELNRFGADLAMNLNVSWPFACLSRVYIFFTRARSF